MIEAAPNPVTAVMRALADPTRRTVFERVFDSREISVAELTRGSGVTQGAISQHLKSLKQAGLVAERASLGAGLIVVVVFAVFMALSAKRAMRS